VFFGPDFDKRLSLLRDQLAERPVSEEVRGWSYSQPPVRPPSPAALTVSELAARYCDTLRDIYLHRVKRVEQPTTTKLVRGAVLHEVIRLTISESKRYIYSYPSASGYDLISKFAEEDMGQLVSRALWAEGKRRKAGITAAGSGGDGGAAGTRPAAGVGRASPGTSRGGYAPNPNGADLPPDLNEEELKGEAEDLHRYLLISIASRLDDARSRFPHAGEDSLVAAAVPSVSERKVDGSLVGLSRELSVDLYTPYNAVIDVKTGEARDFHPLTAAGYALALESEGQTAIDYGVITYLKMEGRRVPTVENRYFVVGDEVRREFLEVRDEAISVLETGKDPGKPDRCPSYCPYYAVCNP